jgi:ATP-dependent helicase/DNAse subunit B
MQLPIYLYLSKRTSKLSNVLVYGFYYQTILQNEIKASSIEDYLKNRSKYIMLQGYSLTNANPEAEFDKTSDDSKVIRSLKKTNGGTYYQYSKVLTTDELDNLDQLVEAKIIEASKDIYNGRFDINPKVIQEKNQSCQFCSFKDICYVNFKNEVKLEAKKDLGFLRGEADE